MKLLTAKVFVIIAILVILHQYLFYGMWWEWDEIHHEAFVIALLFGALVLYKLGRW